VTKEQGESFGAGDSFDRQMFIPYNSFKKIFKVGRKGSNAVLRVKNEATKLLTVGNNWKLFHEQVGEIMTKELLEVGLIDKNDIKNQTKKNPAYKKYFMHGTSHHLGLDTHDYGLLEDPFQENMVFTVEPGIYIPDEGFGIRLEDDVVIQSKGGPRNLMSDIVIEADEIEDMMNK